MRGRLPSASEGPDSEQPAAARRVARRRLPWRYGMLFPAHPGEEPAASGTLLQGCDQNGWDRLHFLTKQRYLPLIPLSDTSAIDLHLHLLGPFHFLFGSWGSGADLITSVC